MLKNYDCVLDVRDVTKTYRVFNSPAQRLKDLLGLNSEHQDVLALSTLSFKLSRGETVGIVGANGSGKSTLLQIICGTLAPTDGEIKRHGRIAALLELGAGFNPEFSGIENVFLNASINGFTEEQTEKVLPDILAFADIGEHIDQPVKTYSSGMYVRLAFSVAIHVEPDLLIIDEALAVGDEAFQRKCFARLRDLQSKGVSILFVSHSAESVMSLCDRALLIDHGHLLMDGIPKSVVANYQKLLYARPEQRDTLRATICLSEQQRIDQNELGGKKTEMSQNLDGDLVDSPLHPDDYIEGLESQTTDYVENGAVIEEVLLLDDKGYRVNVLHKGRTYRYCYRVFFTEDAKDVLFGTLVKRIDGVSLGGQCDSPPNQATGRHMNKGSRCWVEFSFVARLNVGAYFFNAGVSGSANNQEGFLARKLDALMFKVAPMPQDTSTSAVDLQMQCTIK